MKYGVRVQGLLPAEAVFLGCGMRFGLTGLSHLTVCRHLSRMLQRTRVCFFFYHLSSGAEVLKAVLGGLWGGMLPWVVSRFSLC